VCASFFSADANMPYVIRDTGGKIVQVSDEPLTGAIEQIEDDSAELRAFHKESSASTIEALRQQLAQSDTGMARLVEDLIDVLINKGVIKFTDLPPAAGAKYLERLSTRERMHAVKSIIVDEGDII
jgi:hypothetical protein